MTGPAKPNAALACLLSEAGWRAADLARAVNELAAGHGLSLSYDRTTVAHWLTGAHPRSPVPELAAQAFSRRLGRIVLAEDTGLARPGAGSAGLAEDAGTSGDPVHRLLELCRLESDPARRGLLLRSVYQPRPHDCERWPPAIRAARTGTVPGGRPNGRPRVSASNLDMQRTLAGVFAELDERYGSGRVLPASTAFLRDEAVPALLACPPSVPDARLASATAHLVHLHARMRTDMRCLGAAQSFHRVALELAVRSNDRAVFAITLDALSGQAAELHHHRYCLRLATSAVRVAETCDSVGVRALAYSRRGVARALLGDAQRAHGDLRVALALLHGDDGEPHALIPHPLALLHADWAQVHEVLGDPRQAITALQRSLDHRGHAHCRSVALSQARLALLLLKIGHVESACRLTRALLEHAEHYASVRVEEALVRLGQSLRTYAGHPKVREVLGVLVPMTSMLSTDPPASAVA